MMEIENTDNQEVSNTNNNFVRRIFTPLDQINQAQLPIIKFVYEKYIKNITNIQYKLPYPKEKISHPKIQILLQSNVEFNFILAEKKVLTKTMFQQSIENLTTSTQLVHLKAHIPNSVRNIVREERMGGGSQFKNRIDDYNKYTDIPEKAHSAILQKCSNFKKLEDFLFCFMTSQIDDIKEIRKEQIIEVFYFMINLLQACKEVYVPVDLNLENLILFKNHRLNNGSDEKIKFVFFPSFQDVANDLNQQLNREQITEQIIKLYVEGTWKSKTPKFIQELALFLYSFNPKVFEGKIEDRPILEYALSEPKIDISSCAELEPAKKRNMFKNQIQQYLFLNTTLKANKFQEIGKSKDLSARLEEIINIQHSNGKRYQQKVKPENKVNFTYIFTICEENSQRQGVGERRVSVEYQEDLQLLSVVIDYIDVEMDQENIDELSMMINIVGSQQSDIQIGSQLIGDKEVLSFKTHMIYGHQTNSVYHVIRLFDKCYIFSSVFFEFFFKQVTESRISPKEIHLYQNIWLEIECYYQAYDDKFNQEINQF